MKTENDNENKKINKREIDLRISRSSNERT